MWFTAALELLKTAGSAVASIFTYKGKKLDAEPRHRQEAQIDQIRKERDETNRVIDSTEL
jgi:adenylate cyclase class IV